MNRIKAILLLLLVFTLCSCSVKKKVTEKTTVTTAIEQHDEKQSDEAVSMNIDTSIVIVEESFTETPQTDVKTQPPEKRYTRKITYRKGVTGITQTEGYAWTKDRAATNEVTKSTKEKTIVKAEAPYEKTLLLAFSLIVFLPIIVFVIWLIHKKKNK